jgi:hypothetical protein
MPTNPENDMTDHASPPGAALANMRPLKTVICAECGREFQARDPRAARCSNACRQRAKYRRKKAKQAPDTLAQ